MGIECRLLPERWRRGSVFAFLRRAHIPTFPGDAAGGTPERTAHILMHYRARIQSHMNSKLSCPSGMNGHSRGNTWHLQANMHVSRITFHCNANAITSHAHMYFQTPTVTSTPCSSARSAKSMAWSYTTSCLLTTMQSGGRPAKLPYTGEAARR